MDFGAAYKETWDMISSADDHPLQKGGESVSAEPKSTITVGVEPYTDEIVEEVKPLLQAHWAETAPWQDKIPLDPDYRKYAHMAAQGVLRCYSVRDNGKIVGYATFIISRHIHHRGDLWASNDIFYVEPSKRGNDLATKLFDFIEDELRSKFFVSVIKAGPRIGNPAAQHFLRNRGYRLVEFGYGKLMK